MFHDISNYLLQLSSILKPQGTVESMQVDRGRKRHTDIRQYSKLLPHAMQRYPLHPSYNSFCILKAEILITALLE